MIQNIKDIKGVGPQTFAALQRLGMTTKKEILNTFPKRYVTYFLDDVENIKKGILVKAPVLSRYQVLKVSFKLEVEGHLLSCIAYQQPYLKHILTLGESYVVKGKFDVKKNIFIVSQLKPIRLENQMIAAYDLDEIPDYRFHTIIKTLLEDQIEDIFSLEILKKLNVIPIYQAYIKMHFPKKEEDVEAALKRFKLEELFQLFDAVSKQKKRVHLKLYQPYALSSKTQAFPFTLTEDQEKIVLKMIEDAQGKVPLKHLIQGDVGSGKTVVAILIAAYYIEHGYQVAFMVPTEILARQHLETVKTLFKDIEVDVLTSTIENKKEVENRLALGQIQLIIGTHILASESISFHQLGLVIIDEQQKFGVDIRKNIIEKGLDQDVIYVTATPIPRTLLRSILGDAKIYTLLTVPRGKQSIKTISVSYDALPRMMDQIQLALDHHQHVFVVVPAIDSDHVTFNVLHTYHRFKQKFQDDVYVLHGQMSKIDQQLVMETFRKKEKGILISTQMIEVGVDIKTATFMIILEAEYFGVSQLHQLRGRLGRGQLKGVCYLVSHKPDDQRFVLLEKTSSGFEISNHDLYLRGPGDMLGRIQSGTPPFKHIDLIEDAIFIQEVYQAYLNQKA